MSQPCSIHLVIQHTSDTLDISFNPAKADVRKSDLEKAKKNQRYETKLDETLKLIIQL